MAFDWLNAPSTAESASWAGSASPGGAERARRAASVATVLPDAPPDGCYRCHQEIYISFFFDGFGHTSKDRERLSNVGRLFTVHPDTDPQAGVYKIYLEGMGRPLSDEAPGVAKVLASHALDEAKNTAKDKFITDPAKESRKEAAKIVAKEWKGGLGNVARKVKSSVLDAFNPKKILEELKKSENLVPMVVSSGINVVADSVPVIRDQEVAAAYLGTGFDARVERATSYFSKIVAQAKTDPRPLRKIRIAIFGFDRGGVAARKFANELIDKICKKDNGIHAYQGVRVQFDYMGLIDCVSSAYADSLFTKVLSPVLALVPGEGLVAKIATTALGIVIGLAKRSLGQFDAPGEFKRVTHHVAATEFRFYKNLDSPRDSKVTANLVEVVYPGSQADVGGGFTEGEDDKSSELARVSLQNMLNEAWSFGVPFKRLDQLKALGRYGEAKLIEFTKTVNVGGKSCTAGDLFAAYTAQLKAGGRAQLEKHLLAHQKMFISWARTVHDRTHGPSQGHLLFVNTVDSDVYNEIFQGPAQQYDVREAYYERVARGTEHSTPLYESRLVEQISDPTIRELATAWVKPAQLSPEVMAFFDHFVHNTITQWNNVSLGDSVFMQLRPIDDAGTMGRFTSKASDAAKGSAKKVGEKLQGVAPDYPIAF